MRIVRKYIGLMMLLAFAFAVMAHAPRAYADTEAFVRVVHGSPDAPAVDVYLNGRKAFEALKFKTVSQYLPTRAGAYVVQVVPEGKSVKQGPVLISTTVTLQADKEYSVIALGKLAKIATQVLEDDNAIGDPAKAKVRLIHLSPDSPVIDLVVLAASSAQDDQKLFSDVTYKATTGYIELDPKMYSFVIRPANTSANILDVRGLTLDAASVTTIYTFGLWSGTPKLVVGVSQDLRPQIMLPVTGENVYAEKRTRLRLTH